MSIFSSTTLACPNCGTPNAFEAVASVNADRRPDLREAILDGRLQRQPCTACGMPFRLDSDLLYIELGRRHWICARPVTAFDDWERHEAEARELFAQSYGSGAPAFVRQMAGDTQPRLVFGWPALREKLVAADAGLDDTVLELVKMSVLRQLKQMPFAPDSTLRLLGTAPDGALVMGWVANPDDATAHVKGVPRAQYDAIAADLADLASSRWGPVHAAFEGALFVDVDRLMLAHAA